MKKIILWFLVLFSTNTFSQNKEQNDYKKLIDSALIIKATNLYNFYNKQIPDDKQDDNWHRNIANLKHTVNNIYVINEYYSSVKLENIRTKIPLKTLDIEDRKNRKLLRKGINVWKIIPVMNKNQLRIVIIDFKVVFKRKELFFGNGGGSTIVFQYSCEEEKWKLIKEEHKGI